MVVAAPTPGSFGGGVGACALAGTAMVRVTVAAVSTEPAMRAMKKRDGKRMEER